MTATFKLATGTGDYYKLVEWNVRFHCFVWLVATQLNEGHQASVGGNFKRGKKRQESAWGLQGMFRTLYCTGVQTTGKVQTQNSIAFRPLKARLVHCRLEVFGIYLVRTTTIHPRLFCTSTCRSSRSGHWIVWSPHSYQYVPEEGVIESREAESAAISAATW